ncbi:lytic transglycosylase domain-containing protein [Usitatibacter palustris]|uniref:Membrane-bound lytic murein transglycosylase F n=1 Tax=Usitatibacter palustris TaxID=2732487 RepID=A0A6M4H6L0_9PROT|nr:lytic transglycosylase domain-containing protein [Usitatibacter palustris]QJR14825.1 Membrane-bound lytic murein transglycosylase F [Usitatibacter palustris]
MKGKSYTLLAACLTAAAFLAPSVARADIYAFTDQNGVMHFTNIKGLDNRYKLVRKEGSSLPARAVPASYTAYMPSEADMKKFATIIDVASREHGVDKHLVHAVISAESGFNPRAVSPKGATGLMQLMPDTARRFGVRNINDPYENIHGGVKYLKELLALFKGDMRLAVAGYNAGENAVIRAGNRIPAYPETMNYVPKVLDYYKKFQARQG